MTRPCPNCNQMNPPDAAFCLNCSASLSPVVGGPGYQQPNPPYVGGQAPYVGAPPQQYGGNQPAVSGGASQRAIIALVLTIVALVCCGPFTGIPAAIVGWLELDSIKSGKTPDAGRWMALTGLWGGIIISIVYGILGAIWILFSMMAGARF